jgi:hypothetical protein
MMQIRDVIVAALMGLATPLALAGVEQDEPEKVPAAVDSSEAKADADATADEEKVEEIKAPIGYRVRKRGNKVVYCRKEVKIDTRFTTEKCFTEEQIAELERQREEGIREFEKHRRVCSSLDACGGGR